MLKVRGLSKQYHNFKALDLLNFDAKPGEVIGLLGPNGSGKSTTLKILAGILSPSGGEIIWQDQIVSSETLGLQRLSAYVPEVPALYSELSVEETLNFFAGLISGHQKISDSEIERIINLLDLNPMRKRLCFKLSKGYQQRVMLAQALLRKPKILLLDEPNTGLDPKQLIELSNILRMESQKMITILSTHQLSEAAQICSRVIGLSGGCMIFDQLVSSDASETQLANLYQEKF
jgi:ABC-2 type transport system ATP-binding protein